MPVLAAVALVASAAPVLLAGAEPSAEVGKCAFEKEPVFPGHFWDPSCQEGMEGCLADGVNTECRSCGGGGSSVPCPPSSCHFANEPFVPYFWDPTCEMGKLGCWADGVHAQCRFCGEHPFTNVSCPMDLLTPANGAACTFADNEPTTPSFWDPGCEMGAHGCNADGIHVQCRFCGRGGYADIPCPASEVCSFANEPSVPYYWDPQCSMGKLGCMADGMHAECRFCATRPFDGIPCPGPIQPPEGQCTFPLRAEPTIGFYWDETCESGKLGCWADGLHAECRFCGSGVYRGIPCPVAAAASTVTGGARYDAAAASQAYMRASSLKSVARDIPAGIGEQAGATVQLSGATSAAPRLMALVCLLGPLSRSFAGSA